MVIFGFPMQSYINPELNIPQNQSIHRAQIGRKFDKSGDPSRKNSGNPPSSFSGLKTITVGFSTIELTYIHSDQSFSRHLLGTSVNQNNNEYHFGWWVDLRVYDVLQNLYKLARFYSVGLVMTPIARNTHYKHIQIEFYAKEWFCQ
jgi:hypothetical protein